MFQCNYKKSNIVDSLSSYCVTILPGTLQPYSTAVVNTSKLIDVLHLNYIVNWPLVVNDNDPAGFYDALLLITKP